MDTTDDPVITPTTIAIMAGSAAVGAVASKALTKSGGSTGSVAATDTGTTARPAEQLNEKERKNRMMAATMLTREWDKPTLSKPGLLGL
jgi:hypothetical protein